MDISDIEIKESGRFALMGKVGEEHADDDFGHANEGLSSGGQGASTMNVDDLDIVGYVDDKDSGNAIARNGGFTRDGKPVFVAGWRDTEAERQPKNAPAKQAISKKDV